MSAPKTAFLSSDLLRETRTLMGKAVGSALDAAADGRLEAVRAALATAPALGAVGAAATRAALAATAPERERLYLRYGGKVLDALEAADHPLSDREMFEKIRDGGFAQFRIALAELVHRGLIESAGADPVFDDQRYTLAPQPA